MLFLDCFDILLFACSDPINVAGRHKTIKRINCTRNILSPSPVMIVADPFLVVKDETLYLFYEEYRYRGKGIIRMTCSDDLVNWKEPKTVLQENFHLSYPWVFQHEGQWFMMPETSAAHEVRLYQAVDNQFDQFVQSKTLLSRGSLDQVPRMDFCDSSITRKDDTYYLFTTVNNGRGNELHLYFSDSLDGTYTEHPQSPLMVSDKYGRDGGSLLEWDGNLFRFAQDCDGDYGKNINVFKVDVLSRSQYAESLINKNVLTSIGFAIGHQYNFVEFKGQYIVAVDQKLRIPYLGCKVKRLLEGLLK